MATKWSLTPMPGCRWSEEILEVLGGGDPLVIASRGENDYQGDAMAVVECVDGRLAIAEWSWGSCSGCDAWEDLDRPWTYDVSEEEAERLRQEGAAKLRAEVEKCVTFVESRDALANYARQLVTPQPTGSWDLERWMNWQRVIDWCAATPEDREPAGE